MKYLLSSFIIALFMCGCGSQNQEPAASKPPVTLITLDPGHFHAALVQKNMVPGIDSNVYVYAPDAPELKAHLALIDQYNSRSDNPAHWNEKVYTGQDFASKMLQEKKGNVVVLAGNNRQKTEYIHESVSAGLNVLADKPMAINTRDFDLLLQSFSDAKNKKVLLYDIMTERSEITNILQREFAQNSDVFGSLKDGTEKDPSVMMQSVHYFFKQVSGKNLTRPDWFFDPGQEGEAITDVGTHLVDLVQWECFPEQPLDYQKDVKILSAKLWPTPLTLAQFSAVTNKNSFPAFLEKYVKNDVLETHANGEINYTIRGKHIKVIAQWKYQAEQGGDTHYSVLKGTKASLVIQQGKEEDFQPTLYIFPDKGVDKKEYDSTLKQAVEKLQDKYPGISVESFHEGYRVIIPQKYKIGHEAHFAQVMERYLNYLKQDSIPDWEISDMIAKYYITTKGVEMASHSVGN